MDIRKQTITWNRPVQSSVCMYSLFKFLLYQRHRKASMK